MTTDRRVALVVVSIICVLAISPGDLTMTRELLLPLLGHGLLMTSLGLLMPALFPTLQKLLTRCRATLQQAYLRPCVRIDLSGDLLSLCGVTGARGQVSFGRGLRK
jgi:hypothetical protein